MCDKEPDPPLQSEAGHVISNTVLAYFISGLQKVHQQQRNQKPRKWYLPPLVKIRTWSLIY
jgi:hypothetical protein